MATLHLVYAVPSPRKWKHRILKKLHYILGNKLPLYRQNPALIDWPNPIFAPFSITYHLIKAFKDQINVVVYDWQEPFSGQVHVQPDDFLLLHPTPLFSELIESRTWSRINKDTIGFELLTKVDPNRTFLILPYTHDSHQSPWLMEVFENYAKNVIFICGKIWIDTWSESPFRNIPLNLFRLDMALDAQQYPVVKTKFNPKGRRKFLYIGSTMAYKNTVQLEKIASLLPGFDGGYISNGTIKGWRKIANYADLNTKYMARLAEEYDFFLNCSDADAQATTILEQMSFGFVVACTPQSGFDYPSLVKLHINDVEFNVRQIEVMQNLTENELRTMAAQNRKVVEEVHSWDVFSSKVRNYVMGRHSD